MKKRVFTGFIITLFFLVSVGLVFSAWCTDSDSSVDGFDLKEIYTYGYTINDKGVKNYDTCASEDKIREYYCQYNDYSFKDYLCPTSYSCISGKCTTEIKPTSSDCGSSYHHKGCYGNDVYWFNACNQRGNLITSCSPNEKCQSGKCTKTCIPRASKKCYFTYIYYYDSCGNKGSLYKKCSINEVCSNAQCIPRCSDSDSGNNIYQKGTVYVYYSKRPNTDTCLNINTIKEYYCENFNLKSKISPCPRGYTCTDGRCVTKK